ncbi:Phthalate dioxygenase reductase OS=Afipia felis OX=1035 GN=ophA1_1 PE=4 SV=1 [Afipia felis]
MRPKTVEVRVRSIIFEGEDINSYEVIASNGGLLPSFNPGAHIDLYFRDGRVRQYSLCNDPTERHHYVFAVQRDRNGRGGSKAIFEKIHVGRTLIISEPRNNFPLVEGATHHILLAGGIGITPMMAMASHLIRIGGSFELHYCTRTPARTAFREQLQKLGESHRVHLYCDGGDPTRGINFATLLADRQPNSHVYFCGPNGFMEAVRHATAGWPEGTVHSESFSPGSVTASAPPLNGEGVSSDSAIPVGFEVMVKSTGDRFGVPPDKSILEVLRENGFDIASSCEVGLCGTCRLRYLQGEVDHRDLILTDSEKQDELLVCCSRSKSSLLVLDI